MTAGNDSTLDEQLAAALAWWREAGVDRVFADEASGWLNEPEAASHKVTTDAAASPPAPSKADLPETPGIGGDPGTWPRDLPQFAQWWLSDPSLDAGGSFPRVAPRGPAHPDLLVLIPQPGEHDGERLLSGASGTLLSAMLSAMRLEPEAVYLAAALPRHTPMPDWDELAAAGLADLTAHHIALAAPKRLIAFGRNTWSLVGHDMAHRSDASQFFNHGGIRVPVMAADGLDRLLRSATARATFWRRWLDWTGG